MLQSSRALLTEEGSVAFSILTAYLSASPSMTQYILIESTTQSGFHYYILFICCLLGRLEAAGQKSEEQPNVADDKNQIINNDSSNLVMI